MTDVLYVAIDISKIKNDVLIEFPDGKRRKFIIYNKMSDYLELDALLKEHGGPNVIGVEPTSNYHRPICYFLKSRGHNVCFVPSISVARTREAIHNSWDKNDPKDAQVILHMLKTGVTQTYYDPLLNGINDIQELSKTHFLISLRKTKTQHSILTHYLPLYFPEVQKYFCTTRAIWFFRTLQAFPSPHLITKLSEEEFIKAAWPIVGRKVSKSAFLADFYNLAKTNMECGHFFVIHIY